jgi:hypothetical protein
MTFSSRTLLQLLLPVALSACVAPPSSVEPETVAVKANKLTPEYSSFNTRVLSDAGNVEHSFTASLDPNVEPLTRLQSAYTQQIGSDSQQRIRIGDTVSTSGMWGSAVRYGGMQFGTRTEARADVIADPELAAAGLAVLPTVEDTLFTSRALRRSLHRTSRRSPRRRSLRRDSSPRGAPISQSASARSVATTRS